MASKPAPKPDTVLYLLELLARQQQEINALREWRDQVEAVWPQIVEVDNGAD
jgi:hypothetical protein